jgi:hypothetical protein
MHFLVDKPRMVLFEFLKDRIGLMLTPDFEGLGRVEIRDGKRTLVGVIGFNNFNGASCHIHMAGDTKRWMSRGLLETAARYVFLQRGLNMMFGLVPSGNVAALEQDQRMGFTLVTTMQGAHPDGALHILQMTKAGCRWLERKKYGQEIHSHAA